MEKIFFLIISPLMQAIFQRKVENFQFCIHMIKKHKCQFSATFSYQKMFVFISVFPNIYDTFNASSVKQSRWFAKSMSSKSSQELKESCNCVISRMPAQSETKELPLAGREIAAYKKGR